VTSVLLISAAFLCALGFTSWALGTVFQYRGIAVLGAVLIVGVGASAAVDGLQHQVGKTQEQVAYDTTDVSYQYDDIQTPDHFPLGPVIMLLGSVALFQSINELS